MDDSLLKSYFIDALEAHMYSGIDVQYTSTNIDNILILHPYISGWQAFLYNKYGRIVSYADAEKWGAERCEKNHTISKFELMVLSKDFSDYVDSVDNYCVIFKSWDFISECYDITTPRSETEKVFLLYISNAQAGLIPNCSGLPSFGTKWSGDEHLNYQRKLLSDRVRFKCSNVFLTPAFYIPINNLSGMGYVKNESFIFDVIYPVLYNDSGRLSDELFLKYLLKQGCNYRRPIITAMAESIYHRCVEGKNKITAREWINHTEKLLSDNEKLFQTEEQKYLLKVLNDFCNDKLAKLLNSNTGIPYITTSYTKEQLKSIYKKLLQYNYIDVETRESDFVYCFSGIGDKAIKPITWRKTATYLTIFIEKITNQQNEWQKVEQIFCGDAVRNLKQAYTNAKKSGKYHDNRAKIIQAIFSTM